MLTTVEKVIFLQDIDIFEHTSTEDLARIAMITRELELGSGHVIFREEEFADGMYLVIEGGVRMLRDGQEVMTSGKRNVFGTWALFDSEPRLVTAVTTEETRLLKVDREDFVELLSDHAQISQSIMKTMVRRLRNLMNRVGR